MHTVFIHIPTMTHLHRVAATPEHFHQHRRRLRNVRATSHDPCGFLYLKSPPTLYSWWRWHGSWLVKKDEDETIKLPWANLTDSAVTGMMRFQFSWCLHREWLCSWTQEGVFVIQIYIKTGDAVSAFISFKSKGERTDRRTPPAAL